MSPLGIWYIMAICPIFPKWDIYQPLIFLVEKIELASLKNRFDKLREMKHHGLGLKYQPKIIESYETKKTCCGVHPP